MTNDILKTRTVSTVRIRQDISSYADSGSSCCTTSRSARSRCFFYNEASINRTPYRTRIIYFVYAILVEINDPKITIISWSCCISGWNSPLYRSVMLIGNRSSMTQLSDDFKFRICIDISDDKSCSCWPRGDSISYSWFKYSCGTIVDIKCWSSLCDNFCHPVIIYISYICICSYIW